MLKRIPILFVLFCCLILASSFNAPPVDECTSTVKAIYKRTMNWGEINKGTEKIFYIDYDVKAVTTDSAKQGVKSSNIKMWMNSKNLRMQSSSIEMYENSKEVITVLPTRKTIIRADFDNSLDKKKNPQLIQDSVFAMGKILSCVNASEYGANKKVVLELSDRGRKKYGVRQFIFFVDDKSQLLKKLRIDYPEKEKGDTYSASSMVYTEYLFHETVFDYSGKSVFPNNMVAAFINAKGQPTSQYSGYKIIDNRNPHLNKR